MNEDLGAQFEANRPRLQSVAYRMLGSLTEAEDAVQEPGSASTAPMQKAIDNLAGWLTTVLSRVCLGMLRSRRTRPEDPLETELAEPDVGSPEEEAILADTMGPALILVLETLGPSERLSFVLHDLFGVPFDNIGPIVGRSPAAARQLASRARRRVQGSDETQTADRHRQQEVVDAFWLRLGAGISMRWSACSTRTPYSEPIVPPSRRRPPTATGERPTSSPKPEAPQPWPPRSPDRPRERGRLSSTAHLERCGPPAADPGPSSPSRS
jgi:RNA polymerase sigma factor (sigma-70 family)